MHCGTIMYMYIVSLYKLYTYAYHHEYAYHAYGYHPEQILVSHELCSKGDGRRENMSMSRRELIGIYQCTCSCIRNT